MVHFFHISSFQFDIYLFMKWNNKKTCFSFVFSRPDGPAQVARQPHPVAAESASIHACRRCRGRQGNNQLKCINYLFYIEN